MERGFEGRGPLRPCYSRCHQRSLTIMRSRRLLHVLLPTLAASLACGLGKGDVDYGSCPDYIACAAATGTPTATIEAQYGEGGLCWDGDEDEQVLCRAACEDAMSVLAASYPEEPTCSESGEVRETTWGVDTECSGDIEETGTGEGEVSPDFALPDQHGDTIHLYDFCGRAVLLMADAAWSGAASQWTGHLGAMLDEYGDAGFDVVVLLGENAEGQDPTAQDLTAYAASVGLDVAVLADPGFGVVSRYGAVSEMPRFILFTTGAEIYELNSFYAVDFDIVEDALP